MSISPNNFSSIASFDKAVQSNPHAPRALCFGDSWFQYVPHPTDVNKQLASHFKSSLFLNEGVAGRDSAQWKRGLPRIQREIGSYQFAAILLSNGGNDVVGEELVEFVKSADQPQAPGSTLWGELPDPVMKHVRLETFEHALQYAIMDLRQVIQIRDLYSRDSVIFVHNYDYIYPSGDAFKLGPITVGPWVKPYLEGVGLTDPGEQRVLTSWLIDQFTRELKSLVSQTANMRLVDSRGTLTKKQQWENEIHPTKSGFASITQKSWIPALTGILK